MTVLAVVPARQGSTGVPGKNLKRIGGLSLVERAVRVCRLAQLVDTVAVSSDGDDILNVAHRAGAETVRRPPELAGDAATSESALLHALDHYEHRTPEVLVMVQCTSPLIDPAHLDAAIRLVVSGATDVAFSAASFHGFVWSPGPSGATGVNHDSTERLRRQDRPVEVLETGAFYVMRTSGFRAAGHRFFGRVQPVVVEPHHAIEIDEPADLALARAFVSLSDPIEERPGREDVEALVMDFDGVHTDNRASVDESGVESVRINRSDGLGIAMLRRAGVEMLILSTETNGVVAARARKLGVACISGSNDKLAALREWAESNSLDPRRILYIGNDINDRACMEWVGWPVAVADAYDAVSSAARCRTSRPGGRGAIREVADWLLPPSAESKGNHSESNSNR